MPSEPATATIEPDREKATASGLASAPPRRRSRRRTRSVRPVAVSQSRTVSSRLADTSLAPSDEKATPVTADVWPSSVRRSGSVGTTSPGPAVDHGGVIVPRSAARAGADQAAANSASATSTQPAARAPRSPCGKTRAATSSTATAAAQGRAAAPRTSRATGPTLAPSDATPCAQPTASVPR